MSWRFDEGIPVYIQIERRISADILSGKYPSGTQIPTVRQIALEAAVNPNTVQKAFGELESKGIVYSQGTVGRFVTDDRQILESERKRTVARLIKSFAESAKALGVSKDEIITQLKEEEI